MITRRTLSTLAMGATLLACALGSGTALAQKKYDPGADDKEIKIGHTNPYSGPASSYGVIGKAEEAYEAACRRVDSVIERLRQSFNLTREHANAITERLRQEHSGP